MTTIPSTPPQPAIESLLHQAFAEHQAGHLQKAEELYLSVLEIEPNQPNANHNLGLIAVSAQQLDAALAYFTVAMDADPGESQYWLSYISTLFQAGRVDDARQVLEFAKQNGLQGKAVDELTARLTPVGEQAEPPAQNRLGASSSKFSAQTSTSRIDSRRPRTRNTERIASPKGSSPSPQRVDALVALFQNGEFEEALPIALRMTEQYPQHNFGWKALGAIYKKLGRNQDALLPMQTAAELSPADTEIHNNLGLILLDMGRLEEAEASYRQALRINPTFAQAHANLATALQKMGRLAEAEVSYQRALQLDPDYALALCNLGALFHNTGRLNEAETSYRKALQLKPHSADIYYNLGLTLKEQGRLIEAEANCRLALKIKPDYVDAHFNLANILYDLDKLNDAEAAYRQVMRLNPNFIDARNNLSMLLIAQGKFMAARDTIVQSLKIQESDEAKNLFVTCIKHLHASQSDKDIHSLMIRAVTEPWGGTSDIARIGTEFVKFDPDIGALMMRAVDAWPERLTKQELLGTTGITTLANNSLLCALLESAPVCDIAMERLLTQVRLILLDIAATTNATDVKIETLLPLYSTLAQQCFINEYVFACSDDELRQATEVRNSIIFAMESGQKISVLGLLAIACYFPLGAIPQADRLLEMSWPETIAAVLVQQVKNPATELLLRNGISKLTGIEDEVSLLVQNQYEESPYPRWIKASSSGKAKNLLGFMSQKFPLAPFHRKAGSETIEILIAGCGTGQQSIAAAQRFLSANILAIDLSLSSLAYARRKTQELGLTTISYAQADLLELDTQELRFDVIESCGVLHHLADPWAGWQILLSMLRQDGYMKLGLYSEIARQEIVQIRDLISAQNYGSTADDIRQCRQDLMGMDQSKGLGDILASPDFFSTSTCRDLLFHVHEHRLTLTDIDVFLRKNNLIFIGFEIEVDVLHAYKQRFPEDPAATNLEQWQIFEIENPDTFANMYQFWIQKADS